jgi:hypothetical protein
MRNFFISYNKADKEWAAWIAWQLEEAGYTTTLQDWDFRPADNFAIKMNETLRDSERVIAVLSQSYLNAQFTHPEWATAFRQDPTGSAGTLLPVLVAECDLKGLFSSIVHINLVGKDEAQAKKMLLDGVVRDRAKPLTKPDFPGTVARSVTEHPTFPGPRTKKLPILPIVIGVLIGFALVTSLWSRPFRMWLEPPRPCSKAVPGDYYEAEAAELSGDASKDIEHAGFSGDGYVSGYGHGSTGTMTTFWVYVEKEGLYQAELCYGNGTGSTKTLSLLLDGSLVRQTRLPHTARWNLWTTQPELLTLHSGRNAISYVKTANDNGQVNLDFMRLAPQQ